MKPIIFLDIDDVIALDPECSGKDVARVFASDLNGVESEFWMRMFSTQARDNLASLHKLFRPQYVISSSWCNYVSLEQMRFVFLKTGFDFIERNLHEKWRTPRLENFGRLAEVQSWIEKYHQPLQPLLILDDFESAWNLVGSELDKKQLVIFCEARVGFDTSMLSMAIKFLQRQIDARFVGLS